VIDLKLGARDRRTALVGFGVVSSLLLLGRAAPAWYAWRHSVEESTRATLADAFTAKATVDRRGEIGPLSKRMELFRMEVAPVFVNGSGLTAASAALASVVAGAATLNGVRIGSLQANSDSSAAESGGVTRVRLRGEGSGNLRAVTHFLAALEDGLPLVAIRELSITREVSNASGGRVEALHIEFEVEGMTYPVSGDEP
jgi:hypothetical protein